MAVIDANRGWGMAIQEKYDVLVNWRPAAGAASAYNFYCLSAPVGVDTLGLLEYYQNISAAKFDGVLELVYGSGAPGRGALGGR